MKTVILGLGIAIVAALPAMADLAGDLAGKTLVAKNTQITLGADGSLSGKVGKDALQGSWTISKGQFCRTITAPARLAGKACLAASLSGGTFTVTRPDGTALVYTVK